MQIHDVEQNSDEWYALRAGIPTASEFSKLVTGTGKKSTQADGYAATLAAEHYAGKPLERWEGNSATERGHEMEAQARATYEFTNDVEIVRVGFVTNHGAGCSPDGMVGDAGLYEGKAQLPKGHVETLAYHAKHGCVPPAYMTQCQGELWICEREWVDLDFYHPELPGLTVRVTRDEAYIRELIKQVQAVLEQRDKFLALLNGRAA